MNTNEILEAIDEQIYKLRQARTLLTETPAIKAGAPAAGKRRGRPKGSVNKKTEVAAPVVVKKAKRIMSAEGKAKIAAAQKARWAAQKKISKAPAKQIAAKSSKRVVKVGKPAARNATAKRVTTAYLAPLAEA